MSFNPQFDGDGGGDDSDSTSSDISGIFGDPAGDGGDTTTTDDAPEPETDDDGGGTTTTSTDFGEELGGDPAGDADRTTDQTDDTDTVDTGGQDDPRVTTGTGADDTADGGETETGDDMDDPGANGDAMDQMPEEPEDPDSTDPGAGPDDPDTTEIDPTTTRGEIGQSIEQIQQELSEQLGRIVSRDELVITETDGQLTGRLSTAAGAEVAAEEFEEQIQTQTGEQFDITPEDVLEQDGQFTLSGPARAELSRQQAREAGRDLTEPISGPLEFAVDPGEPALQSGRVEVGTGFFDEPAPEPVPQPADISGLELGDVVAEQRAETREDLERQLEEQVGAELGPDDIEFEEEEGQVSATLSEAGERRVQIERAPIVGAAETLGLFEPQARGVAGAAVTFREFGRTQRERFVEPSLQSLREATGLESEIEAFESLQDQASAAEERFLQPATELATDLAPEGLAAGAVAVGTRGASLTPPGRVAVGLGLATGAAAEVFEELPAEQQLAVGTAVGTATEPGSRAEQFLVGPAVGSPTVRAEREDFDPQDAPLVPGPTEIEIDPETGEAEVVTPEILEDVVIFPPEEGALPPDQAPPELEIPIEEAARRERLGDALTFPRDRPLAIQEDPIFLPEVLVPTAPQSQFTAGRFTPPEVPTDTADPTEPFGGAEVPLDDDLEGTETAEDFVFPGPEVPTPGQPTEEFAEPSPVLGAAQQQETILRRPDPAIPQDPADVARQTGPGGPAFIIGQDPRVAPAEPVLETPIADIDLSLVRPELARVLREGPELTAEDIFDATLPGTEATGRPTTTTRPGLLDRATPDQAPGLDQSVSQTPRTVPGVTTDTVTTPGVDTATGTPTVTTPEFGTPTATGTGPAFGTPTTTATAEVTETPAETLPALELESEDPRRRDRDFDEFEREFLEPVISPTEALEADSDGPEAMDLSDDMT